MDAVPVERTDRHHDHHGDQGGHRDDTDDVAENHDKDQQEQPREERRQSGAGARLLDVDHRLTDHRAATHAAEEPGDDVGHSLAPPFAGLVGVCVSDVVDQLGCHQRLHQSHEGHRQCVRRDDRQGVHRERHIGDQQGR